MTACPPDGTSSTFTPPSCTRGGNVIGPAVCTPDSNLQTGDTVECTCMECNTVTCSFTVIIATVPVPVCNPNPCDNGGICVVNDEVPMCICLPGFTGQTCNDVIPACSADTCDNGGTCIITNGEAVCICPPGFTGQTCAVPVVVGPACLPNPCMGGAECRPDAGLAGYTCHTSVGVPCL